MSFWRFVEKSPRRGRRNEELDNTQNPQLMGAKYLSPRQEVTKCESGLGQGDCVAAGSCRGFFNEDKRLCPQGDGPKECCMNHRCSVPEGAGLCQSTLSKRCEIDGKYFEGEGPPWPCVGPDDVQCCVRNENITTPGATTSPPPTSSLPPSTSSLPPPTSSLVPTTNPTDSATPAPISSGLSAGAKGGIAGGVVGGVLLIGFIAALFFFLGRKRRASENEESPTDEASKGEAPTAAENRRNENDLAEKAEADRDPELLGSPLSELGTTTENTAQELESPDSAHGKLSKERGQEMEEIPGVIQRTQVPQELPANPVPRDQPTD
ncbi:hypothetical protein FQN55_001701 [Onygenales sp. PD_40]|nr:hypothetical protein FQN55_001701 [Onygenales sp. PD_40]